MSRAEAYPRSAFAIGARRLLLVAIVVLHGLAAVPDAIARDAQLENVPPRPHGIEPGTDPRTIASAIAAAARHLGWTPSSETADSIDLSIVVRMKHTARVRVGFDADDFWIDYVASANLNYSPGDRTRRAGKREYVVPGPRIHPNYNRWVRNLAVAIEREAPLYAKDLRPAGLGPAPAIADEIEKLEDLRRRGVLSDEEFERGKARILDGG